MPIIEEQGRGPAIGELLQRSCSLDLGTESPMQAPRSPNLGPPSIKSLVALQKLADETTRHHRLRRMSLCPQPELSKTHEALGKWPERS